MFGLQNHTLARCNANYINHVALIAKTCTRIVKKTEIVNSLNVSFEKDFQLNITFR